ncbi:MAG TPA: hypothetical protein VFZ40_19340 [Pyrinomonadaceae bacterium]
MSDKEVEAVLEEIKARIRSQPRASEGSATSEPNGEREPALGGEQLLQLVQANDEALAAIDSCLTTTERAWDRLPPIISKRRGVLARLELWIKQRAGIAGRWFTWEQVNFNAAVHHALQQTRQALSRLEHSVFDLRTISQAQLQKAEKQAELQKSFEKELERRTAEVRHQFEQRNGEARELHAQTRADLREVQDQAGANLRELRAELRAEAEALRIEIERRRIETNALRASVQSKENALPGKAIVRTKAETLFAAPYHVPSQKDCFFYHSMELPKTGTVEGHWDLRGRESEYLGGVSFAGKRVLEIGPGSGHLSFFMERAGAEVVSVEAADDFEWEFGWNIPEVSAPELELKLAAHREMMRGMKNSYWFAHEAFKSKANVHYGSAYALPDELGRFDISVIACVLLHNKNPLTILENCARLTTDTIVVVENFRQGQLSEVPAEFLPKADERLWDTWWGFSPRYFVEILRSMGFPDHRVSFHQQICQGEPVDLFSVVARRFSSRPVTIVNEKLDVEITSAARSLHLSPGALVPLPIRVVNCGRTPVSSSIRPSVLLSYHWLHESGDVVDWNGLRTAMPRTLYPGESDDLMLMVRAPADSGSYCLAVTLVEEHVKWYDDEIAGLPLKIMTTVSKPAART